LTRDEFDQVMALLDAHWHNEEVLAEGAMAVYAHELRGFGFDEVRAAVETFAREGERRMPLAGQIYRKVIELRLDPPPWAEVSRILAKVFSYTPDYSHDGERANDREAFVARQHPLIRSYVQVVGLSNIASWNTDDRVAEAQFRRKWEDHVKGVIDTETMKGIDAPGLRAVERANRAGPLSPEVPAVQLREIEPPS
jgi:hypothetical protein